MSRQNRVVTPAMVEQARQYSSNHAAVAADIRHSLTAVRKNVDSARTALQRQPRPDVWLSLCGSLNTELTNRLLTVGQLRLSELPALVEVTAGFVAPLTSLILAVAESGVDLAAYQESVMREST